MYPHTLTAILLCIDINLALYSGIITHNMDYRNRKFKLEKHLSYLLWTGIGSLFWMVLGFILVSSIGVQWKANILKDSVPFQLHGPNLISISDDGLLVDNSLYRTYCYAVLSLQKFLTLFSPVG